jgi:cephalosporin-C deacetylase
MPGIDFSPDQLASYKPPLTRPRNFKTFWTDTLQEARRLPLNPQLTPADNPFPGITAYELSYAGWRNCIVKGLYILPKKMVSGPFPVVICYHGYSGSRGFLHDHLSWLQLGCAVISVDTRGQGGETGNNLDFDGGTVGGWMTQGLRDPHRYYYRAAYVDCVRAVDFAATRPELDAKRIAVQGGSQGGALTIAVAGLDPRPAVAMPDVPFLSHFRRAVDITPRGPYPEIAAYLAKYPHRVEETFLTLSYFDGMNFAPDIRAASLWSVGLWDDICPPSTIYAAYHHAKGKKQIETYTFNNHEGGGGYHHAKKIRFLRKQFRL